jgi:phenylalanyl-tRNA synthetase beta chain
MVSPGIRLVGGLADCKAELKKPAPIELSVAWLIRKLGRPLSAAEVRGILESLEFGVEETAQGHFSVTVPSWRATKDVSIKDDLLEEVGRMVGYDSITPTAPLIASTVPPENPARLYQRNVRRMAAAQGFTEVYNYSFISEEMARAFDFEPQTHVRVTNPIASDQTLLRRSLLPRVGQNILDNSRRLASFRLFEIGREIHGREEGLPEEVPHFAAAMYTRECDGVASLFELKRLAECLMPGCAVAATVSRRFEHPERSAAVSWQGTEVGRLFELHPSFGLEGRAAILDVNLEIIQKLSGRERRYEPLRRFPTSAFDLSVLTGLRVTAGEIEKKLADAAAASDLVRIEFVRQHVGPPLPEDRKSMSYRLTVGATDRTLSSDDVAAIRSRVIESLQAAGYELRV